MVHGVAKSRTQLSDFTFLFFPFIVAAARFHYWRGNQAKGLDREVEIHTSCRNPPKATSTIVSKDVGAFCSGWIILKIPLGVASSEQMPGAPGCWMVVWIPILGLHLTIQCPENPYLLFMIFHKDLRSNIIRCSHFWLYQRQWFPNISQSNTDCIRSEYGIVCAGKTAVFVHHILKEFLTLCTHLGFYIVLSGLMLQYLLY